MYKKLLLATLLILLVSSFTLQAAEEGENKFNLTWQSTKTDFPTGVPYTLWGTKVLPDLDNDGRNELFVAADDPVQGAWYFVLEAQADDVYEVVWYVFIENCTYSYVLANSTADADLDGDGLPELIAGVAQSEGSGWPGVWIWEKDSTITDAFPFPVDAPTCTYDVNNNSSSVSMLFAAQLDSDDNIELVIGETHDDIIYIVEETGGDLSFPLFEIEYQDDIPYSPWGYYHGDLDNDGMPDFAVGEWDMHKIHMFENTGVEDGYDKLMTISPDIANDGTCLRGMGARDINGDGLGEIIYVQSNAPGNVWIITNPGEMALVDSTHIHSIFMSPDSLGLEGVAYGDFDHGFGSDGPDIYFVEESGKLYDLEYIGETGETSDPAAAGDPDNWVAYVIYQNLDQDVQQVAASDFDRDGEGEIAIIYAGGDDENYIEIVEHEKLPDAGFEMMWHDDPDTTLLIDPVHGNPRGIFAGSDVDQDGNPEIICTEYNGKFHVYEVIADNTIEWVFSYKDPHAPANGSQPRDIKVGDVDGNGLDEIFCLMGGTDISAHPDSIGFYFFEWDGVNDNGFGIDGGPTYILPVGEIDPRLTRCDRTETIMMADVDDDGNQEVLWPSDGGTGGDGLYIFSCIDGELTGFPTWLVELAQERVAGEMTGSPKNVTVADMNGNGQKEVIFATWNNGQLSIFEAIAPDTYEETVIFTDATVTDETIYKGMGALDVDGDGDDELIFNSYWNATIYMINAPANIADIDVTNPEHYTWLRDDAGGSGLTGALGDQDQDGKPEFYITLYTRGGVRALEYNGGADIMAQSSWDMQEVFVDRDYIYDPTVAPVTAIHGSFGIYAPENDLDGDNKKEIVVSMIESPISDTWLYVFESDQVGSSVRASNWKVITPNDYQLAQNFPNPFNPTTSIAYTLPLDKQVTVKIYNMMGQEVKTLLNNKLQAAGTHNVTWDATDNSGKEVTTGSYVYSLEVGNLKLTKRMTLVK
jgi:hypothetical protein